MPFADLDIPAHSIMLGGPADSLYHTVHDEVETLNIKQMAKIVQAIALAAAGLIDGSVTPGRISRGTLYPKQPGSN